MRHGAVRPSRNGTKLRPSTGDDGVTPASCAIVGAKSMLRIGARFTVPFVAHGVRTTSDDMALNIDYAPTIAALAGVTPQLPEDGRSLVPLLHGESPPWRHQFEVEYLGQNRYRDGGPPPFQGIRTTRWLYVEYRNGWRELYDLRRDPWELQNVASDPAYATVRASLHILLDRLYAAKPHAASPS